MASIVTRRRTGPKRLLPAGALPFRRRLLSWYGRHRRRLPRRVEELRALPGIGRYTAGAVASLAYGAEVPAVDTNAARVLARAFGVCGGRKSARRERRVWALAAALVPRGRAADWNQALMDLGATYCTARRPRCQDCPVRDRCATGRTRTDQDGRLSPSSEAATRRPRR